MLAYLLPSSGPRFCIGPGILVSAYPQGVKGVRHKVPETTMKPRKESVLETPKKEHSHRITASSAKRAGVEAEEQVADDVVQADRVPEVAAVVVARAVFAEAKVLFAEPTVIGCGASFLGVSKALSFLRFIVVSGTFCLTPFTPRGCCNPSPADFGAAIRPLGLSYHP